MRKKSSPEPLDDDLRPEYGPEFFKNMKPNRFANVDISPPIYLDEDVAPKRAASKRPQKRKAS